MILWMKYVLLIYYWEKIESIKYSVYFKLQISDNLGVEKLLLRKIALLWYATS